MSENKNIQYISIDKIHPHPRNPRHDVGDVTELAESVKKNGVLQNLTVVPGETDGTYTVIIGHRRLAAAKLAELTEVPCVVADMTDEEQFHTMLTENMQRIDLTPMEQAQGFQIMFDEWGYDEKKIAETTGFSETTVRRRLNMAKLDAKSVEAYENNNGFQLSLADYYILERVPTIEERNEILKNATSSRDIQKKVVEAETKARRDKAEEKIIQLLKETKADIKPFPKNAYYWDGTWENLKSISLDKDVPNKIPIGNAKKDDKLYYRRTYDEIIVCRKRPKQKKEESAYDRERKEYEKRKKQIGAILNKMAVRRRDLVLAIIDGKIDDLDKKKTEAVKDEIWRVLLLKGTYFSKGEIVDFILGKRSYDATTEEQDAAKEKAEKLSVLHQMLAIMCIGIKGIHTSNWECKYSESDAEILKVSSAVLEHYGWTFEGDEQSVLDGTHELYTKKAESESVT